MDFTGIIAEYDPFHNGHAAQLAAVRAAGAQCIAVCMSSGAVQRGGVPILPESVRVRAALDAGADLVVALPAPYACATAEQFAAISPQDTSKPSYADCQFILHDELNMEGKSFPGMRNFSGTFDGNGYRITEMTAESTGSGAALFLAADGAVTLRLKTDSDDMHKVSRSIFFAFEKEDQALLELSVHKASLEDVFLELTESGQAEESKQYTEEPNETEVDA